MEEPKLQSLDHSSKVLICRPSIHSYTILSPSPQSPGQDESPQPHTRAHHGLSPWPVSAQPSPAPYPRAAVHGAEPLHHTVPQKSKGMHRTWPPTSAVLCDCNGNTTGCGCYCQRRSCSSCLPTPQSLNVGTDRLQPLWHRPTLQPLSQPWAIWQLPVLPVLVLLLVVVACSDCFVPASTNAVGSLTLQLQLHTHPPSQLLILLLCLAPGTKAPHCLSTSITSVATRLPLQLEPCCNWPHSLQISAYPHVGGEVYLIENVQTRQKQDLELMHYPCVRNAGPCLWLKDMQPQSVTQHTTAPTSPDTNPPHPPKNPSSPSPQEETGPPRRKGVAVTAAVVYSQCLQLWVCAQDLQHAAV